MASVFHKPILFQREASEERQLESPDSDDVTDESSEEDDDTVPMIGVKVMANDNAGSGVLKTKID